MCRYELKPENANSISITFTEFNTAGDGDFMAIYNSETQELYYKLFGQTNPGILNFNTGKLMIIFKTDLGNTATGWNLSYTSSQLTGMNEDMSGLNPSVSPNPANNQIQLTLNPTNSDYTLKLLSTDGKLVYTEDCKPSALNTIKKIDVSDLPRGLYVLQIRTGKGISFQKVVLN